MQSLNILVIEDHEVLRSSVVRVLQERGHCVHGMTCAEEVDDSSPQTLAQLYVIDIDLPGEDGLALAKRIRKSEPSAGIIMVTGRSQVNDRLASFTCGADIFLAKPVDPAELVACVEALSKRLTPSKGGAQLRLDPNRQTLSGPDRKVLLTRTEVLLLAAMSRAADRQLESWQAMEYVDPDSRGLSRGSLEVCMSALRKKLAIVGADQPTIQSVRGVGYRLCVSLAVEPA